MTYYFVVIEDIYAHLPILEGTCLNNYNMYIFQCVKVSIFVVAKKYWLKYATYVHIQHNLIITHHIIKFVYRNALYI